MAENGKTESPEQGKAPPPEAGAAKSEAPAAADVAPGKSRTDANHPPEAPREAADGPLTTNARDLEAIYDIPVQVAAVLGKTTMQVSQLLKLGRGAVVELDRKVGEAIDIYVNNRLVARGEVVVVEDRLGVTMTEIVRGESLPH